MVTRYQRVPLADDGGHERTLSRRRNVVRLLEFLEESREATRAEIARALGVAASTTTTLVADLIDRGVVEECPSRRPSGGRGRPGHALRLAGPPGAYLAIDLDHDLVRIAISLDGTSILAQRESRIDSDREPARVLSLIAGSCADLVEAVGVPRTTVRRAVLGVPAPVHPLSGAVGTSAILPAWRGVPVAAQLARLLSVPVEVENDANLAILSAMERDGDPAQSVLFVKASAGLGASLVLEGRLQRGTRGVVGEIGHVRVPGATGSCRCGSVGCLETVSSTTALFQQLQRAGCAPEQASLDAIRHRGARDDPALVEAIRRMGFELGVVLSGLCSVVGLDQIVIGGELPELSTSYVDGTIDGLDSRLQPSLTGRLRVGRSALGADAVLYGGLARAQRQSSRARAGMEAASAR